jgi:mannosyltransferase OCH1-like enzyme
MKYPKIIHQTYKDIHIPEDWKISQIMWKKMHPDYQYMFWTDLDIRNYIKINYPEFLNLHDSYKYNIQRADMIRYFILYDFGGIYSDLDIYPIENIESHLTDDLSDADVLLVKSPNIGSLITNSFMISKKKALIWKFVHEKLKEKTPIYAVGKHLTIMYSTGPSMLTNVIYNHPNLFKLLPTHKFMAYSKNDNYNKIKKDAVLIGMNSGSWNGWDSKLFNFLNKHKKTIISSTFGKTRIENIKNITLKSNTKENCDLITVFSCKIKNTKYINDIKKLDYIECQVDDNDNTNITIKFNNKDTDGYKLCMDLSGEKNNDNDSFEFYDLILATIHSKKLLLNYISNKIVKSAYLNYANTDLYYSNFNISIVTIKEKMKKYNYLHTSSFLFALNVYAFWKKTSARYIKCSNLYIIPFLKDNNKVLNDVFFVSIKKTSENIFESIYNQIKNNAKSINDILGLNSLLNVMKYTLDKTQITSESTYNVNYDVVFSNLPIKMDWYDLNVIYKQYQPEKMSCFCLGNTSDEIMFSLVFDKSMNDVQHIFTEVFNSL